MKISELKDLIMKLIEEKFEEIQHGTKIHRYCMSVGVYGINSSDKNDELPKQHT